MRYLFIGVIIATLITGCRRDNASKSASLVVISSADHGDTASAMTIAEIQRNANTSKLKFTYKKMGSSVGSSMFIARALYEIARARGTEYFINLKEWEDPDGGYYYIAGFTNTRNPDIHKEFGTEYDLVDEFGQAKGALSVSQFSMIFEKKR